MVLSIPKQRGCRNTENVPAIETPPRFPCRLKGGALLAVKIRQSSVEDATRDRQAQLSESEQDSEQRWRQQAQRRRRERRPREKSRPQGTALKGRGF